MLCDNQRRGGNPSKPASARMHARGLVSRYPCSPRREGKPGEGKKKKIEGKLTLTDYFIFLLCFSVASSSSSFFFLLLCPCFAFPQPSTKAHSHSRAPRHSKRNGTARHDGRSDRKTYLVHTWGCMYACIAHDRSYRHKHLQLQRLGRMPSVALLLALPCPFQLQSNTVTAPIISQQTFRATARTPTPASSENRKVKPFVTRIPSPRPCLSQNSSIRKR